MSDRNHKIWRRVSLVEQCEAHVDCVNRTAPIVNDVTPFKMIRTTNVRDGFIDLSSVRYVTEDTYIKWTRRLVPRKGDIILTREAPLGEVGKIRTDGTIFLGQRLYHFRPDPKKLDADFLLYSLQDADLQGQIRSFGSGSTVEHMRLEDINKLQINLPPLPQQRRIAGILTAYDELIDNSQRRIAILESMARGLFREWFVRFQFPGHRALPLVKSSLGNSPKGWRICKLGDILELKYGKALKQEERRGGPIPVFASSGIVGYHDECLARGPGIIVGRKGNVGSVYWSDDDFFVIDTAYFVTSSVPLRFLYYDLQTKNFLNTDAAVPGLSRHQAYALETVIPPAELLARFRQLADDFERQASILRRQIQNLRRTRDLLLPRLLSGQIDLSQT